MIIPLGTLLNFAPISGIYKITNCITKKVYIGQSKHIYNRLAQHANDLKTGKHHCAELQNDFYKYDYLSFDVEIICECPNYLLLEKESEIIEDYHKKGIIIYNEIRNHSIVGRL